MQVLSLTSPGVQVFDAHTAVSYARTANDCLAKAVRRHPSRFVGLTAIATRKAFFQANGERPFKID